MHNLTSTITVHQGFDIAPLLRDALELDNDEFVEHAVAPKRSASPPNTSTEDGHDGKNPNKPPQMGIHIPSKFNAPNGASVTRTGTARTHKNKMRRSIKRGKDKDNEIRQGVPLPPTVALKHIRHENKVNLAINLDVLPASTCGYQAKIKGSSTRATLRLGDLLQRGFSLEHWDGRSTKAFVDPNTGKIFAVAVGSPNDEGYARACDDAYQAIYLAGQTEVFKEEEVSHRRGQFPALNVGVSYGHGPDRPHNLKMYKHEKTLRSLLQNPGIVRMANFASSAFKTWAPGVFEYYRLRTEALFDRMPALERNFRRSVYTCAAFNFGPQVATYSHRDCMNCPFGWCAIQALGHFDHTKGGHLVLEDLKMIIEFPHGSCFLIPSATVKHGNTPVQPGETRLSFTQFTAGSIFRYVDNGFRTEKQFEAEDENGFNQMLEEKKKRWEFGLGLWSTVEGLISRAQSAL